jgi:hypothetical protein
VTIIMHSYLVGGAFINCNTDCTRHFAVKLTPVSSNINHCIRLQDPPAYHQRYDGSKEHREQSLDDDEQDRTDNSLGSKLHHIPHQKGVAEHPRCSRGGGLGVG